MVSQFEPTRIPGNGENVFSWNRSQIADAFGHLDTSDAHAQGEKYSAAASDWDQGLETFRRSVRASIAEAWEGESAEAAKQAITQYTDGAAELTDLLANVSANIKGAADAIVNTKNAIPAAARHSWTANVWPPRAREEEKSRSQANSDAQDAMLQQYVRPFGDLDRSVPVVPASVSPLKPVGVPGPTVSGPTGGPNTGGPTVAGPGATGPDHNGSDATGPDATKPDATDPNAAKPDDPSGASRSPASPTGNSAATNPSATGANTSPSSVGAAPTTPSGVIPGGVTPGSVGPGGVPVGSGYHPGSTYHGSTSGNPGSTPGGPGRSVPGLAPVPGAKPFTATRAGASASGANGAPGMGGAGGKRDGDEDREHQTPDYLITEENTRELLGDIPGTVPGGVIGGGYDDRGRPEDRH